MKSQSKRRIAFEIVRIEDMGVVGRVDVEITPLGEGLVPQRQFSRNTVTLDDVRSELLLRLESIGVGENECVLALA